MTRAYNSTIKIKQKICVACGKPCVWFSKKRCQQCAKIESIMEQEEKEAIADEDLSGLIEDADTLVSKYVRRFYADANGEVKCFTCPTKKHWTQMQAGHYVSRKHLYLRWDLRNLKPQCETCNCMKHGNISVFSRRLEDENTGITEILLEESRIVYKPSREEVRGVIADFSMKLKLLKQKL